MVVRVAIFNALLLTSAGYAVARGGAPERIAGASLTAAAAATLLVQSAVAKRFVGVEYGVLAVDVALLGVLLALAARADRWWTLVLAALQGLGTMAHVVRVLDPQVLRFVYALLAAAWGYPMLLVLVAGTRRHASRVDRNGGDRDWSPVPAKGPRP